MSSANLEPARAAGTDEPPRGLYRTTLAGPGKSLADAFANIERAPEVGRILRHPGRDLLSARVNLTPEEGQGFWELLRIRADFYLIVSNFTYNGPRFEIVPGDDLVQFNFKVSGDLNYGVGRPGPLRFNRPSLHVWRQPRGIEMREWTAPRAHERMVSISVRPEFLIETFLGSAVDLPDHLKLFVSPSDGGINHCDLPLTSQMMDISTRLIDNAYAGSLYLVNAEALTLQLLCAAIDSFWSARKVTLGGHSERELAALGAARQMIVEKSAPAPTLRELARAVGLAEKALTRGFKAVYGETVFEFSLRCRMQYALTLLRDRRWSVERVAEAAGYTHPTSFATAFRRHFGMRPIDMKQLRASPVEDRPQARKARRNS